MKQAATTALFLVVLLFAASCTKENRNTDTCGYTNYSDFNGFGPTYFQNWLPGVTVGTVVYQSHYTAHYPSGKSQFQFATKVDYVCAADDILVSPYIQLKYPGPITDTLLITMNYTHTVIEGVNTSNGTVYKTDVLYHLNTSALTTDYQAANTIYIPYQGSWSADSAYFFGIVDSFNFRTQYTEAY